MDTIETVVAYIGLFIICFVIGTLLFAILGQVIMIFNSFAVIQ